MKVVVLGSNGMLGHAVVAHFGRSGHEVVALTRGQFDLAREPLAKLHRYLAGVDAVINCAAIVSARVARTPIEEVLRVNAVFPHNLSRASAARSLPCFQLSTDAVFSGKTGGYDESSPFDAEDVYGMSKAAGEPDQCMVLRTSMVGEENGTSQGLLEWARSQRGREVNGFVNHRWNGLTTLHLAEVLEAIIVGGLYAGGVFHLHSPETVSKYHLLLLINEAYELGLSVAPVEAGIACDRSLRSLKSLSASLCVKPISQQLAEMRRFFSG